MYLFFDTETTGLPRNWKAPITDLSNWPRLVQLAFLVYDKDGIRIYERNYIIKPEGFHIPKESSDIHKITNERAIQEGVSLTSVLGEFYSFVDQCQYLVAHNMSFDEKIVGAELLRNRMNNILIQKKRICTMISTTDYCAIEGYYGYKWPKLSELHFRLFGEYFEEAHNAAFDINATAKCFFELKRRKVI